MHRETKPEAVDHDGDDARDHDAASAHARRGEAFDRAPVPLAIVGLAVGAERRVEVHCTNDAFARLGLAPGALPAALVADVLADGEPRRASLPARAAVEEQGASGDGAPRLYDLRFAPLFDGGDRPTSVLVSALATTAPLARATRLHERLRGMVGHDLRNPLSAVMTAASLLLRRGGLPAPQESAARRIESAAQRMARMITHILELSRAALDEETLATRAPGDLAAILRSALVEHETRVELVLAEATEDGWAGAWDGELLRDAFASIVRNAVEHSRPETRARVTLGVAARDGDGGHDSGDALEIVVDNDGAPIAPAHASRVVDVDHLGDHGKRPGHLGLGLFVATRAIAAHGGRLTVTARGDDGTRVRIVLPRAQRATQG